MGGNTSKFGAFKDSISFKSEKASQSVSKKIKGIYLDESLLPVAGIFVVGTEYVESYSENGKKLVFHYKAPTEIFSSSINFSNTKNCTLIAIACVDNNIYLLESKTLSLVETITVSFKLQDIELPGYEVICSELKYLEVVRIDSVLTPFNDSLLVGLSNGFVAEYSLTTKEQIKIYNPIALEFPKAEGEEKKSVTINDARITGALSLIYGSTSQYIFANHRKSFMNLQNQPSDLEETPISVYKHNEGALRRISVKGDILATKVLENRSLYIVLTSVQSEVCVFNFEKGSLILKTSLDLIKNTVAPLYFTGMTICEYAMSQRNETADKVYKLDTPSKEVIDGDVIIGVETSGSILISKLGYENASGKIAFAPLKYINAAGESKVPKNNTILVSRLLYSKSQDKLYFTDQENEIVVISNMLKTVFSGNAAQ